jgi:hypothetical protein
MLPQFKCKDALLHRLHALMSSRGLVARMELTAI